MALALVINMDYPIDYETYSTEEIIVIVEFLSMLEQYASNHATVDKQTLLNKYERYREILNNLSEEKRIDRAFSQTTNIPIYKTMQSLIKSS